MGRVSLFCLRLYEIRIIFGFINDNGMDYKNPQEEWPECLECGKEIRYGRPDKKFCSEDCKNKYHNNKHKYSRNLHYRVLNGIERNYEILNRLYRSRVESIDIGDLLALGFRLEYSTGYRKSRRHDEFHCFEFRYYITRNRLFGLQKMEPLPDLSI